MAPKRDFQAIFEEELRRQGNAGQGARPEPDHGVRAGRGPSASEDFARLFELFGSPRLFSAPGGCYKGGRATDDEPSSQAKGNAAEGKYQAGNDVPRADAAQSRVQAPLPRQKRAWSPDQIQAIGVLNGLGARLDESASDEEIKSAYRKLARLHHPDMHAGADGTRRRALEERFKSMAAAYDRLIRRIPSAA